MRRSGRGYHFARRTTNYSGYTHRKAAYSWSPQFVGREGFFPLLWKDTPPKSQRVCREWGQNVAGWKGLQKDNCLSEMIAVLVMQISNNLVTWVRCGKVCMAVFTSSDLKSLLFLRTLYIRESISCLRAGLLLPTKFFFAHNFFLFQWIPSSVHVDVRTRWKAFGNICTTCLEFIEVFIKPNAVGSHRIHHQKWVGGCRRSDILWGEINKYGYVSLNVIIGLIGPPRGCPL